MSAEDGKKEPWLIHGAEPLRATRPWEDTTPLLDADNLGTFTVVAGASSGVPADIHDRCRFGCRPPWPRNGWLLTWKVRWR